MDSRRSFRLGEEQRPRSSLSKVKVTITSRVDEKKRKQPEIGTQEAVNKKHGIGTPEPEGKKKEQFPTAGRQKELSRESEVCRCSRRCHDSARSRTCWCVPQASDVHEMSKRERLDVLGVHEERDSSQQPTREVPGSRGGKASEHSAEVDASQDAVFSRRRYTAT